MRRLFETSCPSPWIERRKAAATHSTKKNGDRAEPCNATHTLPLASNQNYPGSAWAVTCRNTLRRRTRPTTPTIVLWPSDPNLPSHSAVLLIQTQGSDLPNPAGPRRGCKLQSNSGFLEPARNSFRDRVLWFEKYDPQPTEAQHNP
jgi:hypothetical protein